MATLDDQSSHLAWRLPHDAAAWRDLSENKQFSELADWQDGRCAMCGRARSLACDHDHDSGLVRGFLCNSCNLSERDSAIWISYRTKPPTQILGLTIRYWDPRLKELAGPPGSFDPFESTPPSWCISCGASPSEDCSCAPFFRLPPNRIVNLMISAVIGTRHADVKDMGVVLRMMAVQRDQVDPEAIFLRDFVLRPKGDYLIRRWFGEKEARRLHYNLVSRFAASIMGDSPDGPGVGIGAPDRGPNSASEFISINLSEIALLQSSLLHCTVLASRNHDNRAAQNSASLCFILHNSMPTDLKNNNGAGSVRVDVLKGVRSALDVGHRNILDGSWLLFEEIEDLRDDLLRLITSMRQFADAILK